MTTGSGGGGRRKGTTSRPPAAGRRAARRPDVEDAVETPATDPTPPTADAASSETPRASEPETQTPATADAASDAPTSEQASATPTDERAVEDATIVDAVSEPAADASDDRRADAAEPRAQVDADAAAAATTPAPTPARSGGSAIWGLVGAGVGAAAMLFLAPLIDGGEDDAVVQIRDRLTALETSVAEAPTIDPAAIEASVAAQIADASGAQDAAVASVAEASTAALDEATAARAELAAALGATEARVTELSAALEAAEADRAALAADTEARLAAIDALPTEFAAADGEIDGAAILAAARAAVSGQETLAADLRAEIAAAQEADAAARAALADDLQLVVSSAETQTVELGASFEESTVEVAALGARLAEVAAASAASDEETVQRIETLAADIAAVSETTVTPDDLAAIEERVVRAERAATSALGRGSSVGVALAALAQRVEGSEPYARELSLLGEAVLMGLEEAPGVDENGVRRSFAAPDALSAPAEDGLPSPITLAERFDAASRAALAAANRVTADESGGIMDRLSTVMVVRRTDWTEGPEPDAVLARAGAHVARGDLAAAVAELDALGARQADHTDEEAAVAARVGDAARGAAPMVAWLEDARVRIAAEAALSGLYAQLLNVETD